MKNDKLKTLLCENPAPLTCSKLKPKVLVCDFDGTLVKFPFYQLANSKFLQSTLERVFCYTPVWLQLFFAKPTNFFLKKVKTCQSKGIKIIIVTARRDTKNSRVKLNLLLKSLKLKPDKVFFRPYLSDKKSYNLLKSRFLNVREYKKAVAKKIAKEYEIIGIGEDNKALCSTLKQFGPILNLDQ